jgi:hypothetical protein
MPVRRGVLAVALVAAALAGGPAGAQDDTRVVALATGDVTGAYFPVGVALCRVVNERRREHGLRCAATPSAGSLANLEALRAGEVELALVQSDAQAAAWRGTGTFASDGPDAALRAVMALHPEPLTLVARADAGIAALADLPGKRVSVGPAGAGQRLLVDALLAELGWRPGAFAETLELDPGAAANALCEGRLDAFFFAVGHPALAIREAASCGARLVELAGPEVDALVAADPFHRPAVIPAGTYVGQDAPVRTFGVGATLVAAAAAPEGVVETVAGAILDNLGPLAGFDPRLAALERDRLASDGLTAPLHPGAEAAFRARGLLD